MPCCAPMLLPRRIGALVATIAAMALAVAIPGPPVLGQSTPEFTPETTPETTPGSAPESTPTTPTTSESTPAPFPTVVSHPVGKPHRGSLASGVLFPASGTRHTTWDPGTRLAPAADFRHWGTAEVVRRSLCVLSAVGKDHPDWPKVVIGDLSLPSGGPFGREYGGLGHSSHQNGLDIDVYYPRADRTERAPETTRDVDFARARELVDRFVHAGADRIFVGTGTPLHGPEPIVQRTSGHRDHFHVRFPNPEQPRPTTTLPPSASNASSMVPVASIALSTPFPACVSTP